MELRGAQELGGRKGPGLQAALAGVEGATQNSSPMNICKFVTMRKWERKEK